MRFKVRRYENVLSTIEALFSAEMGASEDSVQTFLADIAVDKAYRDNLRSQIKESLQDREMSWKHALWDEDCHVEDVQSEDEARDWVVRNLLRPIEQADGQPA